MFFSLPLPCSSKTSDSAPSCESIKRAMQTYARQGGTSTIMICDDGMQLIDPGLAAERRAYYADHGIGWIARPPHSSKPDGFKRAGRFKKASNMNYALKISLKLEEHLARFQSDENALNQARTASQLNRALKLQQNAQEALEGNRDDEAEASASTPDVMGWANALAAAASAPAKVAVVPVSPPVSVPPVSCK